MNEDSLISHGIRGAKIGIALGLVGGVSSRMEFIDSPATNALVFSGVVGCFYFRHLRNIAAQDGFRNIEKTLAYVGGSAVVADFVSCIVTHI